MSRGLVYLHSKKIIHGDLKAVSQCCFSCVICASRTELTLPIKLNVLIDDGARAVLCDFGLSRVRSDVTTRTMRVGGPALVGSRNWMAPELLTRGSLKKPCDIYAFGMTIYEVRFMFIPPCKIYTMMTDLDIRQRRSSRPH
jgi:serine/threonine protein kinase